MEIFEKLKIFISGFTEVFTRPLFEVGETSVTISSIFFFCISIFLLFFLSGKIKNLLVNKLLARYSSLWVRQSVGTIVRYIIILLGLIIIIQSFGINLSSLNLLAGALGVGIGFGLQNITNNFISGIIILFERPIKIGDRVEVGEIEGDVVDISARSTTILTNDNISIIVPNSDFISSTVINWSHNDRMIRLNIPVGVSYKEDPRMVKKILLKVVEENHGVLKRPAPEVLFESFGESSLDFKLRIWTSEYINRPRVLKSQLYYAIFKRFRESHIEIPFPQRDLHLKSGFYKTEEGDEEKKESKF